MTTTRPLTEILADIARIEALIDTQEAKGKVTALKAAHRKLCSEYRKAAGY